MGIIFTILISPLHLCSLRLWFFHSSTTTTTTTTTTSSSFSDRLCELLSPALHVHERLVRAKPSTNTHQSDLYSASRLVFVLIFSSVLCLGFVMAAWIAAFFWVFGMVLGNPEPTTSRSAGGSGGEREKDDNDRHQDHDDDGCAAVLGVGVWWAKWLKTAYRQ